MNFLIDNNFAPSLALHLINAGHHACHVREMGLHHASDEAIFEHAAQHQRVIISQDTDFGTILASRRVRLPSVILFRCTHRSADSLGPILLANLPAVVGDLESGSLVVIDDASVRVRRLPLL